MIAISSKLNIKNYLWAVGLKGSFITEWKKVASTFDLRNLGDSFLSLWESVLTVYALARSFGMAPKLTKCSGFVPLAHRSQWVDEIKGVVFINDSKATNVDATICAKDF